MSSTTGNISGKGGDAPSKGGAQQESTTAASTIRDHNNKAGNEPGTGGAAAGQGSVLDPSTDPLAGIGKGTSGGPMGQADQDEDTTKVDNTPGTKS